MKRKLMILLTVVSMAFLFIACGGKSSPVEFELSDVTAKAGETVAVEIFINSTVESNAVALYEFTYDADVLEIVSLANLGDVGAKSIFGETGLDQTKKTVSVALMEAEKLNGKICEILFKVKDGAKAGSTEVSMTAVVKNGTTAINAVVKAGTVTVAG